MGLIDAVARAGAARAHVLVVEAPGAFRERVALERALAALGWCAADSVADADVLAVVGEPGPGLRAVVERTWHQMSEPRARVDVPTETDVAAALAEARTALLATEHQRAGAGRRSRQEGSPPAEPDDMSPDGIPLAEGADDRDGLEMDVLHLPLGPVLAHWPAGRRPAGHAARRRGRRRRGRGPRPGGWQGRPGAGRRTDPGRSAARRGGLGAGARGAAGRCRPGAAAARPLPGRRWRRSGRSSAWRACCGSSRVLRWLLGPEHDRLVDLVERAAAITGPLAGKTPPPDAPRGPSLDRVPELVRGQELAAVRLRMAALGPDLTDRARAERSDG